MSRCLPRSEGKLSCSCSLFVDRSCQGLGTRPRGHRSTNKETFLGSFVLLHLPLIERGVNASALSATISKAFSSDFATAVEALSGPGLSQRLAESLSILAVSQRSTAQASASSPARTRPRLPRGAWNPVRQASGWELEEKKDMVSPNRNDTRGES